MLASVLIAIYRMMMWPEELAVSTRVRGVIGNCIEFMVTHNGFRRTGVHHAAHDGEGPKLVRTTVDEIADEYCCPARITPNPADRPIAHALEQRFELFGLPVNVTVWNAVPSM